MREVANLEAWPAASSVQASADVARARARLDESTARMQEAFVLVGEAGVADSARALALVAAAGDARRLVALRLWSTLVADVRAGGARPNAAETDSILLSAREAGRDHVEVAFAGAQAWVKLPRLALEDFAWRSVNPRIRGAATPAVFPLGELWHELPRRAADGGVLAAVVEALRSFSQRGRLPDTHRLPLWTAAIELEERLEGERPNPSPARASEPAQIHDVAHPLGADDDVGAEEKRTDGARAVEGGAVCGAHRAIAAARAPTCAAMGLSASMTVTRGHLPPACDDDVQADAGEAAQTLSAGTWRRPRSLSAPGRLVSPEDTFGAQAAYAENLETVDDGADLGADAGSGAAPDEAAMAAASVQGAAPPSPTVPNASSAATLRHGPSWLGASTATLRQPAAPSEVHQRDDAADAAGGSEVDAEVATPEQTDAASEACVPAVAQAPGAAWADRPAFPASATPAAHEGPERTFSPSVADVEAVRRQSPDANLAAGRGRSPRARAPSQGGVPGPANNRGPEGSRPSGAARGASVVSRPSTPPSSAYSSLPSSCLASPRSASPRSREFASPGSVGAWGGGRPWLSSERPTRPAATRHGSSTSFSGSSFGVLSMAASEVAGSDEDWADAVQHVGPPANAEPGLGGRAGAVAGAAGWRRLLDGWARDGVGLGIALGTGGPETRGEPAASEDADASARARAAIEAFRARPHGPGGGARDRALAALGATLHRAIEASAVPELQRARCIEVLEVLADDELGAAWTALTALPRRVAEQLPAATSRRLLRRPPPHVDDGVRTLAEAWLRRLAGNAAEASALFAPPTTRDARAAGEALARLEFAHATWSAEPALQLAFGRVLALAGAAASHAACQSWAEAVARTDGAAMVATLAHVGAGHPLVVASLAQCVRREVPASAASALIELTTQKLAQRRGLERPVRARVEAELAALIDAQPDGWVALDWDQASSWRLVEVCPSEMQARALVCFANKSAAGGEAPAETLQRSGRHASLGLQLQLTGLLVPAHAANVALAQAAARVVHRVARQQAGEPGTLQHREAAAVVALVRACRVVQAQWQGARREVALQLWRALDDAGYLLVACAASGLSQEASEVVAAAVGAESLEPNALWGAATAVAALAAPADDTDALPAVALVDALLRCGNAVEAEVVSLAQPAPRSSLAPAVLAAARRLGRVSRADEEERARLDEVVRLRRVRALVARFASLLATQAAYVLARQPLPAATPAGRERALDWTRTLLRLLRTRQVDCVWAGGELPLQALRGRMKAFAAVEHLLERHVEHELARPLANESERLRLLPVVMALAEGSAEAEDRRGLAEAVSGYFGIGFGNALVRLSAAATPKARMEARIVAMQASKALHAALLDHADLSAPDACAGIAARHRELVLQVAWEGRLMGQQQRVPYTVERSFRLTPQIPEVRAALQEATCAAMRTFWRDGLEGADEEVWAARLEDLLRLCWGLFARDPAFAPLALALLDTFVDEVVAQGVDANLQPALAILLPGGEADAAPGRGFDPARATLAAQMGEVIARRGAEMAGPGPCRATPNEPFVPWDRAAAAEAWVLALATWTETLAPSALAGGYGTLAAYWPGHGLDPRTTSVERMQPLEFALLDVETREEVLRAMARDGAAVPALNHDMLQRMSFLRPLSPSELAVARGVAGYAGPYGGVAQQPLEAAALGPA